MGVAGASLLGGIIGSGASEEASSQQVAAERQALAQQQSMFQTEQNNEQPFVQQGQQANTQLSYLLGSAPQSQFQPGGVNSNVDTSAGGYGSLNAPFTAQNFQQLSPAYQFQAQQGAQGTLNMDSNAQGAESGAALKDLQSYNQNFANTSFNNAFNQYQTQQSNVFNRLSSLATLGSNAGSNSATGASAFASGIGNTTSSIGASQAAGTVGAANALSGGLQSGAGAFYSQNALNQILQQGSTTKYQTGTYNPADPSNTGEGD